MVMGVAFAVECTPWADTRATSKLESSSAAVAAE
jgi:hypothetical protein